MSGPDEFTNDEAAPTSETPAPTPPPPPTPPVAPPPPAYDPAWVLPPKGPRMRWINPQRKTAATLIAAAAAIVLLGIGAVGGAIVSDGHGDHRGGDQRSTSQNDDGDRSDRSGPHGN